MKLYRKPALGRRSNPDLEDIGAKFFSRRKKRTKRQKRAAAGLNQHNRPRKKKKKAGRPSLPYGKYIQSAAWASKREEALDYFGRFCMVCGTADQLHVHHKSYKNLGREDVHDLEVLCRGCHGNRHEGQVAGACDDFTREFLRIVR